MMPGMDAITASQRLREICNPRLPILAVGASTRLVEHAHYMHAYSRLLKPFELEHISVAVRRGLLESGRCLEQVDGSIQCC
jgi:CheY-like chemotaxis protein